MKFDRQSREYVFWPITGQPEGAEFEVTFDDGATWLPMETVEGGARTLLAGPDVDQGGAEAVLPLGRTMVELRLTDTPEVVVRGGGVIDVE